MRARDEFISIAAHELRTPVAAIKGTAQLALRALSRSALSAERLDKTLHSINQIADRLTALTDELLDASRIQGGQLALRTALLDFAGLVRDAATRQSERAHDLHVVEADVPEPPVTIDGDAGRLEQVLDNLIDNALKYSPAGGTVQVTLVAEDGWAELAVRDSGIGLPPGAEAAIFQPFGRARNAASSQLPGMGLGLYICRRIVDLHGGHISAESPGEDCGTTLRVRLPLAHADG